MTGLYRQAIPPRRACLQLVSMTTAVQRMLLRAFTCKSMRDAHPKMRSSLRLDEVVLAAARVLARQIGLYAIKAMPY